MDKVLLKIQNLKKYYFSKEKTAKALDDISLEIYKGEVWGLIGVNGAGKTTLSSILTTQNPPTDGEILFNEKSIFQDLITYRKIFGFCPQKPNLIFDLTVKQNSVFAGRYFGLPEKFIKKRMNKLVETYGLSNYLNSDPDKFSGGYKQRVSIARSLMHNPRLLILDEPTVGLNPHICTAWKEFEQQSWDKKAISIFGYA